tara:strand:- start:1414 stop:2046 length:633 start_codon:yes stop_codon:yes gene_type:complete
MVSKCQEKKLRIVRMPFQPENKERFLPLSITDRSIVLVGLMGAGKTCIGRRLANKINWEFIDTDAEIEAAADCTIEEIFNVHGEEYFRKGEQRVIARLLKNSRQVLATGGGAFQNIATRKNIRNNAISIWLKADLDILLKRISRRNNRPLLNTGNRRKILKNLIKKRYPAYSEADIVINSGEEGPNETVQKILNALIKYGKVFETQDQKK